MADRSFLDWPFLDDGHRALAQDLDAWCAAHLTDHHPDDIDGACRALVRALGDAGWLRYCVPAAYGGVHDSLDIRSLAAGPTFAHGITKTQLNTEWAVSVETAIEMEAQAQAICMATNDFRRAFEAFADKRTPEFAGD